MTHHAVPRRTDRHHALLASYDETLDALEIAAGIFPDHEAARQSHIPAAVTRIRIVEPGFSAEYVADPTGDALTTADGRTWRLSQGQIAVDRTVTVPGDHASLQAAVDALSALRVSRGARKVVLIEAGHRPASGLVLRRGDWSDITIRSVDPVVRLDPAIQTPNSEFITGLHARMPEIDVLFDLDGRIDRGLHCVDGCEFVVRGGRGFINARLQNIEVRSSVGHCMGAVATGAGDVGLRIQRNSKVRATGVIADDCGTSGIDVSRGSIVEVQTSSARNCGHARHADDPSWNNMGGLTVRRSFVVADGLDASGSARGISVQNGAHVVAPGSNLSQCLTTAIRATGASKVVADSSTMVGSAQAVVCGPSCEIDVSDSDCGDAGIGFFGSGGRLVLTGASYTNAPSSGSIALPLNSPDPRGHVIDTAAPRVLCAEVFQTVTFTLGLDEAAVFAPPGTGGGRRLLFAFVGDGFGEQALISARINNPSIQKLDTGNSGGEIVVMTTNGGLTGTTGTAGKITIAADSAGGGRIWVENRRGGPRPFAVTVLAMSRTT